MKKIVLMFCVASLIVACDSSDELNTKVAPAEQVEKMGTITNSTLIKE